MKKIISVIVLVAVILAIIAIALLKCGMTISFNGKDVIAFPTATSVSTIKGAVTDDDGYNVFVGDKKEALEFFETLSFQEAVDFAANDGEFYKLLPETAETLKKDTKTEWSVELLDWEGEVEVYRLGNSFPVAKEDGSIEESSSTKKVATMSDRRAGKEAFCTTHNAIHSNWTVHEVHAEAPNWKGTLKESLSFDQDLFKALVAYKVTAEVDGEVVEGWSLAWRECSCEYEPPKSGTSSSSKKSSGSKSTGTKRPSSNKKPETDHNKPEVTPEPTSKPATDHNKPSVTVEPEATKAPALGESSGTGSSSSSSHSKPSSSSSGSSSSASSSSSSSHSSAGATAQPALGE